MFVVYSFYDANGDLLYVGQSINVGARIQYHSTQQPWFSEVADIRLEYYPNDKAMCRAEIQAIARGNPKYNYDHTGKAQRKHTLGCDDDCMLMLDGIRCGAVRTVSDALKFFADSFSRSDAAMFRLKIDKKIVVDIHGCIFIHDLHTHS